MFNSIFEGNLTLNEDEDTILGFPIHNFNISAKFDDVPLNGDFYWLLFCLSFCTIWITYIVFYNSYVFGFILTKLINHVIIPKYLYRGCKKQNHPYVKIGSFSITFISGKIMFRDFIFITGDYSLRIQDGWLIFRWWVPYEPKDIRKSDFSQSDTRVSCLFNGFELHLFNRSELYAHLEKIFLLPSNFHLENNLIQEKILKNVESSLTNETLIKAYLWRDFFPVTKIVINSGRLVFGNSNVPTTLLVTFEESHITYTSKSAVSRYDLFTHISKCKARSFKIILANSPNYIGQKEEPPRFMGEGFVVFESNCIDFYYYQDEPGFASSALERFELSTGDVIERFTSPAWGLDVKSGKGTDLRYGPWVDRQRDFLYNFFYPPDYQLVPVTERAKENELRFFEKFDFRLSTLSAANIDILFTDNKKETNVTHLKLGPGSYFEVSIPLISKENGYHSDIVGQLLHLDLTTTLAYRYLAQSETLEFKIKIEYPRMWNHQQTWHCDITSCKTSINLIYAHKIFFQSLIEDWAGKDIPDILKFVPYICKCNLVFKDFEIIFLANEYNWIDCESNIKNNEKVENLELAICGDVFDMAFDLPFSEFLPELTIYKIWIQGESLQAALHVPEINPHHETIKTINKFAKLYPLIPNNELNFKEFITPKDLYFKEKKWCSIVKEENNWVTCWSVPIVAISINYNHHPVPPKVFNDTLEKKKQKLPSSRKTYKKFSNFDPGNMQPDLAEIEIEIGPSKICLHGLLLRALWNIKENYMGESQLFNDFSCNQDFNEFKNQKNDNSNKSKENVSLNSNEIFDERLYRPFAVTVSLIMHDLHGHLMKACFEKDLNNEDPLCPYIYLEKLCFEMDKSYRETKMQLVLSPVILRTGDFINRPKKSSHLNNGHLLMNSLQFRGHALFSNVGRSLESETLEYGWLVEVEVGKLSGKLTAPQLYHLTYSLNDFFFQLIQEDSSLQPSVPYRKCLHDNLQSLCPEGDSNMNKICPNSEDIKYKMVRFSIQSIDLCLVESNNLIYLQIIPIKFSTCNLHSCNSNNGITFLINNVFLKHFIIVDSNINYTEFDFKKKLSTSKKDFSTLKQSKEESIEQEKKNLKCYEALNLEFGPIFIDSAELLSVVESYTISQKKFLSIHDAKTKKLWFLWQDPSSKLISAGKCGCVGGCAFFGNNLNGKNFFNLNTLDEVDNKQPNKKVENLINERFEKNYDYMFGESLLKPGEPILGFKLNSINEEIEEEGEFKYSDKNLNSFKKQNFRNSFMNSPNIMSERAISPFYLKNLKKSVASTKSMSPLFLKTKLNSVNTESIKSHLNISKREKFFGFKGQSTIDCQKILPNYLFSDKNRSLSETGIEKSLKFDFKTDKVDCMKQSSAIKKKESSQVIFHENFSEEKSEFDSPSIRSQLSSALNSASDKYFSAEELTNSTKTSKSELTVATSESNDVDIQSSKKIHINETKIKENVLSSSNLDLLESTEGSNDLNKNISSKKIKRLKSISSSSSSFLSACSTQNDSSSSDEDSIYDLRDQMEKPILESPLLMSTYSNYLTMYECRNWWPKSESIDLLGSNYIPLIKQTTFDGLSSIGLVKKRKNTQNKRLHRQNHESDTEETYEPGCVYEQISEELETSKVENFQKTHKRQDSSERVISLGKLEKQISKTLEFRNEKMTILVKIDGNTEIKISPLCLDGLKSFIETLTTTVAKIHPLSTINHLNRLCCKNVESKNYLKKEKTLEYGQLKLKAWHSTMERERGLAKNNSFNQNIINTNNNSSVKTSGFSSNPQISIGRSNFFENRKNLPQKAATVISANLYEETKNSKFQIFVKISNINVYVLQASLVEQLVDSFTINHLNDCTCVSLLAINISNANFDYSNCKKERRSLHTFVTNNAQTPPASIFAALTQKDLVSKLFSKKPKKEQKDIEPLTIETQELLLEETVGLGSISKLHVQLNRLKNSSSLLNDALLTIIPKNDSKVDFEILNMSDSIVTSLSERNSLKKSQSLSSKVRKNDQFINFEDENQNLDDNKETKPDLLSSFIMFEAGLENIKVNGVKKKIVFDDKQKNLNNENKNLKKDDMFNENCFKTKDDVIKEEKVNSELRNDNDFKTFKANENIKIDKKSFFNPENNASSLSGEIKTIWFNFAAPPKTPNTKKIDFTKLDWHLISTATPAINAWLISGDRILLSSKKCKFFYERRIASILACLMSAALEIPGIHIPIKSKFWTNHLTPFSKALHEDPSCQLMAVLRRYLSKFGSLKEIEENLKLDCLPSLKILRKGVISLSRQWKNELYMPLLVEQNIKYNRGDFINRDQTIIPLRLLINENNANLNLNEVQIAKKHSVSLKNKIVNTSLNKFKKTEVENDLSNQEILDNVDETTNLLRDNGFDKLNYLDSDKETDNYIMDQSEKHDGLMNESKNRLISNFPYMLPRSSLAFPILSNPLESLGTGVNKAYDFLFSPNCVNGVSLNSKKSKGPQISNSYYFKNDLNFNDNENYENNSNLNFSLLNNLKINDNDKTNEENLYLWTIKQQDYMNSKNLQSPLIKNHNVSFLDDNLKHSTLGSVGSDDPDVKDLDPKEKSIDILPGFVFMPTGIQLGNVKVIFEPLLVSLAIENIDETDSNVAFEQLGPKITLSLLVNNFKIEIVESECSRNIGRNTNSPYHRKYSSNDLSLKQNLLNIPSIESSAFECDILNIGLDLRKVKDFKNSSEATDSSKNKNENTQETSNSENLSTNVKADTEKMPIIIVGPEGGLNEVTTIVNLSIETNCIKQRVNLPLLRLIHQVSSVFENVKETRLGMKSNNLNKWKQSIYIGDLKNEQLLSSSLNSNKAQNAFINNRQSQISNVTNTSSSKSEFVVIEMDNTINNSQNNIFSKIKEEEKEKIEKMPTCWKKMYFLLDLYETTPETKTVADRNSYLQYQQQVNSAVGQTQNLESTTQLNNQQTNISETRIQIEENVPKRLGDLNKKDNIEQNDENFSVNELRKSNIGSINSHSQFRKSLVNVMSSDHIKNYTHVLMQRELTPLVVFGIIKIKKVELEAKLNNLKLEGELSSFHVSITHKEKIKGASVQAKKWRENSLTAQLGSSAISILEENQLIVKMTIGKSLTLISSQNKKGKNHNSALLKIGPVNINIPQHPVALHGLMTRSSRQLSTTFQEFKSNRAYRTNIKNINENQVFEDIQQNFVGKNSKDQINLNLKNPILKKQPSFKNSFDKDKIDSIQFRSKKTSNSHFKDNKNDDKFIRPIVVQFHIILDSFNIGASLLPSLTAQYNLEQVNSTGITGHKAKFTIDFTKHQLSFNTKIKQAESNLPSSASVSLPLIHVSAEYMEESDKKSSSFMQSNKQNLNTDPNKSTPIFKNNNFINNESFSDGRVLRKGSYLNALATIGSFEHSLTTDLLNHLLLVQKVFMKEVNEILQKMSGFDNSSQENYSDEETQFSNKNDKYKVKNYETSRYFLFSLRLKMEGIQITATTPTNSAVRLETGEIDLQLSNRVQNMMSVSSKKINSNLNLKLFYELQVDLNVALGQLFMNPMFEEADPEFQQLTYFRTRIVMRNALQDELVSSNQVDSQQEEKEAVLIVLKRPLLYLQPIALDKAVLVWLNYKNAYEYWNEQRTNLNSEFKSTTQKLSDKVPINQLNTGSLSTLFLQLTIDDLGICLPITTIQQPHFHLNSFSSNRLAYDSELKSAFVITLESTSISACSFGSWASKAKFTGLCIRFADDFEISLDDWKPDPTDFTVMNLCVVSEGTYEICSKTTTPGLGIDAKWLLNVSWRMEGFDIHVDTSIGKQLSSLFKTLTALAGPQQIEEDFEEQADALDSRSSKTELTSKTLERKKTLVKQSSSKESDIIDSEKILTDKNNAKEEFVFRKPSVLRESFVDDKERSRMIEKELNEQAEIINVLKKSGVTGAEIQQEIRKLKELEALVFNDFRRDVFKKLTRKSVKKTFTSSLSSEQNFKNQKNLLITQKSSTKPIDFTKVDENVNLSQSKESSSINSSNELLPLTPTDSDLYSPLKKSYSKDNLTMPQSTSENLLSSNKKEYQNKNSTSNVVENNLFSNLMSIPSLINTSFSGSSLPTESVLSKLFSLSPKHNKKSSNNINNSNHKAVFELDGESTSKNEFENVEKTKNEKTSSNYSSNNYSIQEPNIHFELDVKIFFNSGKCVLHTKDPSNKDDSVNKKSSSLPKEKSFIGNLNEGMNTPQNSFYGNQSNISYNKFFRTTSKANTSAGEFGTTSFSNTLKHNSSSSKLRSGHNLGAQNLLDYTIFLIPGLDIKLHYSSKTVFPTTTQNSKQNNNQLDIVHENYVEQDFQKLKRLGTKKATCYAWMTLHSIPEETIITPHLLDFLEQALEPIPIILESGRSTSENNLNDNDESRPDLITSAPAQYAVYGSFPVDVIVYLHVQPSVLRFSCLPISRVECLLHLPSVDLVFSSKRIEDELSDLGNANKNPKTYTHKRTKSVPGSAVIGNKFGHRRIGSDYLHQGSDTSVGGLSVTGCLADFSLYIFHPYTNKKTTVSSKLHNTSLSSLSNADSKNGSSSKFNTERKDSLSLQVEFVKINISRSRKVVYGIDTNKNNQKGLFDFSKKNLSHPNQKITISFSGLCDIGSASFKYDIRRLSEILAFPKAWYRKILWKRVFLGDQGLANEFIINPKSEPNLDSKDKNEKDSLKTENNEQDDFVTKGLDSEKKDFSSLSPDQICEEIINKDKVQAKKKSVNDNLKENNYKSTDEEFKKSKLKRVESFDSYNDSHKKQLMNTPWETLILFGLNLSKINIHMNMGNVMGNTNWLTKEFRSEGKISINSEGHRTMNILLTLDNSTLDAKGGIVGGQIELNKIECKLLIKEYYGLEPDHVLTAKLNALQTRIDYMGTSILMLRMSSLDLTLRDEWKIDLENLSSFTYDHPTKRPALMFIHCVLSWDQLQILLSKSTTPDIIKIITKLDEFFSQQFHSSKRVFTSLQNSKPFKNPSFKKSSAVPNQTTQPTKNSQSVTNPQPQRSISQTNSYQNAKHHRHWQKSLKAISGIQLHNFPNPLPKIGTILGGTFQLYGNNISIACFAGLNFRTKSWAIFSLRHPLISFATEAQESIMDDENPKTHVIQNFSLSLGRSQNQEGYLINLLDATHSSMATVCKISRNTMFSPQFKHLHEWFQYAFCASELDEVDRFPIIDFDKFMAESSSGIINSNLNFPSNVETTVDGRIRNVAAGVATVVAGVAAAASSSVQNLGATIKKHTEDYQFKKLNSPKINQSNHSKDIMFALPSLQLELKTEHIQDTKVPDLSDPKPKIDCTFVTEFDDHIFVPGEVEPYFFLHKLVTSYIKEKENLYSKTQSPVPNENQPSTSDSSKEKDSLNKETNDKVQTDWRDYNCQTWHLEPTIRLLSWAVNDIEPYGVDFILQKLGFTQARVTIPKWIQRGAMDPLDKVLAELMYHTIVSNKTNNNRSNK